MRTVDARFALPPGQPFGLETRRLGSALRTAVLDIVVVVGFGRFVGRLEAVVVRNVGQAFTDLEGAVVLVIGADECVVARKGWLFGVRVFLVEAADRRTAPFGGGDIVIGRRTRLGRPARRMRWFGGAQAVVPIGPHDRKGDRVGVARERRVVRLGQDRQRTVVLASRLHEGIAALPGVVPDEEVLPRRLGIACQERAELVPGEAEDLGLAPAADVAPDAALPVELGLGIDIEAARTLLPEPVDLDERIGEPVEIGDERRARQLSVQGRPAARVEQAQEIVGLPQGRGVGYSASRLGGIPGVPNVV